MTIRSGKSTYRDAGGSLRLPEPHGDLQINRCRNPACPNFAVEALSKVDRGRLRKDGTTRRDSYRLNDAHPNTNLFCKTCGKVSQIKSNRAIAEELERISAYQIVAAERILQRIATSTNYRKLGSIEAGGYVWHTTGSGKTLTSFKAAQLARDLPDIDKVLFVVDRKDLDYQTMREYERFEKGAANSNTSTAVLQRQLEDPNARIIITTIQKLSRFVATNRTHPVYGQHVVVIFDECHRSQFGDMHDDITRAFRRYHLFGFTGTPIFAANSGAGGNPLRRTTEQAFGDRLHTYTIVDATNDRNVLPFRIDYINTIRAAETIRDKQVSAIDTERALLAPERWPRSLPISASISNRRRAGQAPIAMTGGSWRASTRCLRPRQSRRPSAITSNLPASRPTCPRPSG